MINKRECGVLLPISSLPSKYGIGCFSKSAYDFVDELKAAGQCCWQILPLGPTSYGDSPYQSFSTFAGNPYFISLEDLIQEGVLTEKECNSVDFGNKADDIDYEKLYKGRYKLLRKAYGRSDITKNQDFLKFRLRWQNALDYYRQELYYEIEFQEYMQFKFYEQWGKLKAYANSRGIRIIGDIPIYVALDSADTWASPWLFKLDEENQPTQVAGCPPDGFSATGQLWGNPLYNWDVHRQSGFDWWVKRLAHCFNMYDIVRIDHFRGFDEYYAIPFGDTTAQNGWWEKGPGMDLFRTISYRLGDRDIIAEDLGFLTPQVHEMLKESGFPGMKVLEFAFDDTENSDYLPHKYTENSIVYTGTHDNETLVGWYETMSRKDKSFAREYMGCHHTPKKEMHWEFIRLAMASPAKLAVIPVQDYLGLGAEARINEPSTLGKNWKWRLLPGELNSDVLKQCRRMAKLYGRLPEINM